MSLAPTNPFTHPTTPLHHHKVSPFIFTALIPGYIITIASIVADKTPLVIIISFSYLAALLLLSFSNSPPAAPQPGTPLEHGREIIPSIYISSDVDDSILPQPSISALPRRNRRHLRSPNGYPKIIRVPLPSPSGLPMVSSPSLTYRHASPVADMPPITRRQVELGFQPPWEGVGSTPLQQLWLSRARDSNYRAPYVGGESEGEFQEDWSEW